jgi:hypothetical protein
MILARRISARLPAIHFHYVETRVCHTRQAPGLGGSVHGRGGGPICVRDLNVLLIKTSGHGVGQFPSARKAHWGGREATVSLALGKLRADEIMKHVMRIIQSGEQWNNIIPQQPIKPTWCG